MPATASCGSQILGRSACAIKRWAGRLWLSRGVYLPKQVFLVKGKIISKIDLLMFVLRRTLKRVMVRKLTADSEHRNPWQGQELTSHCFLCPYVSLREFWWVLMLRRRVETVLRNSFKPFLLKMHSKLFISLSINGGGLSPPQSSWIKMTLREGRRTQNLFALNVI